MSEKKEMEVRGQAKDTKGTLGKIWSLLANYKIAIIIVMVIAVLSVALSVVSPYILGKATDEVARGVKDYATGGIGINLETMAKILIVLFISYLLSSLLSYLQQFILVGITQRTIYNLRKRIQDKLRYLPLSYFDGHQLGDILSRVTNDVDLVASSLQQSLPSFFTSALTIVLFLIGMLVVSPKLTLIAIITLPIAAFVSIKIAKFSQKYFRGQQEGMGEIGGYIEERFTGYQVIRAYGKEADTINEFSDINTGLYKNAQKSQFISNLIMPISKFFGNLGYIAVAIFGGIQVIFGVISIGSIQTFIQYLQKFNQPISDLSGMISELQMTLAAAERVFEFLEETEEVPETLTPVSTENLNGDVAFSHVRFGYNPAEPLITDLNINVKSGDKVAIVGPTGAGKTTLVNLLLRFYDIQGGTITIDGIDIMDMTRGNLRGMFGMVLQDTWLFAGSIRDNIKYGKLEASDEEVVKAAKNAYVHDFIKTLPGGYDMPIKEDADNISGGQKQLITIARALIADPEMLILDEATSSVDTRTEKLIQKAMDNLMEGRTSFIIAHRLSTIRDSEMILVLDNGDIVESGTHDELLAANGFYANLYKSQLAGKQE